MKKTVIPLLILAAVLTSSLRNLLEPPEQIADLACTVITPMFWQLLDELVELQLARSAQPASPVHTDGSGLRQGIIAFQNVIFERNGGCVFQSAPP